MVPRLVGCSAPVGVDVLHALREAAHGLFQGQLLIRPLLTRGASNETVEDPIPLLDGCSGTVSGIVSSGIVSGIVSVFVSGARQLSRTLSKPRLALTWGSGAGGRSGGG